MKNILLQYPEEQNRFAVVVLRLETKIKKTEDPIERGRNKLKEAFEDMAKLQSDFKESKYFDILETYHKAKSYEIQNSMKTILCEHNWRIIRSQKMDCYRLVQVSNAACETLRKECDKLDANTAGNQPNAKIINSLEAIHKIFVDDEVNWANVDAALFEEENSATGFKRSSSDNDEYTGSKRMRSNNLNMPEENFYTLETLIEGYESDPSNRTCENALAQNFTYEPDSYCQGEKKTFDPYFKRPQSSFLEPNQFQNPNETVVLSSKNPLNCTVSVSSAYLNNNPVRISKNSKRTDLVSDMLSDQTVIVKPPQKPQQLKDALLQTSTATLMKTVGLGKQKENGVKSPNRVRKSPRTATLMKTMGLVKQKENGVKSPNRVRKSPRTAIKGMSRAKPAPNSAAEPPVRLNRTASFRTKKF